jgi:homoserine dehydrogenase
MNAVLVKGDQVGQTLYYGPGAGAGPTASAVIADLLDVVRLMAAPSAAVAPMAVQASAVKTRATARIDQIKSAYYLRISAEDKPGVLRGITQALADESISVEAMNQQAPANEGQTVDLVILTNKVVEASMNAALEKISQSAGVLGEVMRIRVDSLN